MIDVTVLKLYDNLILPLKSELDDNSICELQSIILTKIEETNAKGLVVDVSALGVIDSFLGRVLVETAQMAKLMGTTTVLVGLKKEIVLTLIQLGLPLDINTAMTLEQGLEILSKHNRLKL